VKVLVTGGAGRLGSEVVRLIASRGDSAVAFDLPQAYWGAVEGVPGVEALPGDVTDKRQVSEATGGADAVIHLAALLPPRSEARRELTMRVNVEGTSNIVEDLGKTGVPLVFASSIATYGVTAEDQPPIRESHPLQAHDLYSESKIEAERLIGGSGVDHVILRIAPIAVADLVELPETVPYRGDQRVEHIYVEDAAAALLSALDETKARGDTFNIAGGPTWQMTGAEYIERFYDALGVEVEANYSEGHTAVDWYDTRRGLSLGYQRLTFNGFLGKLRALGEQLGLR
jgi:UDP-glucose 4-epimerase